MIRGETTTKKKIKTIQIPKPKEEIPEIDLSAKLYPITEYVDETGKVVLPLRGTYETGSNDNEADRYANEFEGYQNLKRRTRWVSWNELQDSTQKEQELISLNRSALPIVREPVKGGSITLFGHEYVRKTKINHLLSQNPVVSPTTDRRTGFTENGCGENKVKHYSPSYHPISTAPHYEYWDERQYQQLFDIDDKSPDTYHLRKSLNFKCDVTGFLASSNIVYINPNNNQTYVWRPKCRHISEEHPWHQITDHEKLEEIGGELGIEIIRYKKAKTDDAILKLVRECQGINRSQIGKVLGMTKDKVKRKVARLKRKHLVRTKNVKKAVCLYPILNEMGKDLLYRLSKRG